MTNTYTEHIETCLGMCNDMMENTSFAFSQWEEDFIYEMALALGNGRTLTPKQEAKLIQIYDKSEG